MRTIAVERLEIGHRFERGLRDQAGRALLAPGEPVTGQMIGFMKASGWTRLQVGGAAQRAEADSGDGIDDAALTDDQRLRALLRERWAARARLRAEAEHIVDRRRARWTRLPLRVETGASEAIQTNQEIDVDDLETEPTRAERIGVLRRVLGRLVTGEEVGAGALSELVDELIDEARRRGRGFAPMALGVRRRVDSLAEHCFAVGALSVGIGVRLGWPKADLRAAGLAGMLADSGLALLSAPVRTLDRPLTEIEVNAVRRHTMYSAALVERIAPGSGMEAIPESVQLAAYQHHERENGTGYPDGLLTAAIHDIAKVVAVADVLSGAVSPRAHRPAMAAPAAIAEVVRQATAGFLDRRAARALVDLCGVYPPGSRVRLNTGHEAVVVCNGRSARLDRPVVRVLGASAGMEARPGEPLDLSWWRDEELRVVAALAA